MISKVIFPVALVLPVTFTTIAPYSSTVEFTSIGLVFLLSSNFGVDGSTGVLRSTGAVGSSAIKSAFFYKIKILNIHIMYKYTYNV